MKRTAIDLLWLRPGKVGGTEFFIRNLLDGLSKLEEDFAFVLLVSKDNADTFVHYTKDRRFAILQADIASAGIGKRIIWQNLHQNKFLKKHGITRCFEPVYCKPWLNGGVEYTCVIHDLQALHYPEYHPFHEIVYSRMCWRMDVLNAARIFAISNWVREDIIRKYHRKDIGVIYNPILVTKEEVVPFGDLKERYHIDEKGYFYTIGQLIPHKNIETLLLVMQLVRKKNLDLPGKLLITGINGNAASQLQKKITELGLQDNITFTGFISNEERNTLYQNCHTFLFPSVFEGFGMPTVEAMYFGARVVTTQCACIPEVTQGKAVYVQDPYDAEEWIQKIETKTKQEEPDFGRYAPEHIARLYLEALKEDEWKKR